MLVVVNSDGDCFVFDVQSNSQVKLNIFKQFLVPVNITASIIADIGSIN